MNELENMIEYANNFFTIANAITVFCILQTVTFLLSLAKDSRLLAALLRWRPYSSAFSKWIGQAYMTGIIICGASELWLRFEANQSTAMLVTCLLAVVLRTIAVYFTSALYLRIFISVCREEDWRNRNFPNRESETPRLVYKLTGSESHLYERAAEVDSQLFDSQLERVIHARDFHTLHLPAAKETSPKIAELQETGTTQQFPSVPEFAAPNRILTKPGAEDDLAV